MYVHMVQEYWNCVGNNRICIALSSKIAFFAFVEMKKNGKKIDGGIEKSN